MTPTSLFTQGKLNKNNISKDKIEKNLLAKWIIVIDKLNQKYQSLKGKHKSCHQGKQRQKSHF